jgi:fibronectin type 3 domain-containing protein
MTLRTFFLFIFITGCYVSVAQDQQQGLKILAKTKKEGIWLRWAPENAAIWQMGNQYGYKVERFTLLPNGELLSNTPVILTNIPLKPLPLKDLELLSQTAEDAEVLGELIYGEKPGKALSMDNPLGMLAKSQELENRFGMALLISDMSTQIAEAAGLFFKDSTAVKGSKYIYRISLAAQAQGAQIAPAVVVVEAAEEIPLIQPKDLKAEFADRSVTLNWQTLTHKGIYSAYYIEKSTDGKKFNRITDLPYVHMSEQLVSTTAYYVDSLEKNQQKYYYRTQGITPFGEIGPYSNIINGEGKENLAGLLILRSAKALEKKKAMLTWEFPKEKEAHITGFKLSRSSSPDGPFKDTHKKLLATTKRDHTDQIEFYNSYYVISAIDKSGAEMARSLPFLLQVEDNDPPAIPTAIKGSIDTSGRVSIYWKPNTDADLLGYRVFKANKAEDEFVEISKEIIKEPLFDDVVNINVLDKKIYYKVIAVDLNYNTSNYSSFVELSRPDIIPPAPPAFTSAEIKDGAVVMQWINSVSEDAVTYTLSRVSQSDTGSTLLATWEASKPKDSFIDKSIELGKSYRYKLTVTDSTGNKNSASSKETFFETGFRQALSGLEALEDREQKVINLRWKNSAQVEKCIIYRKKNDGQFSIYQTLPGNIESFTDKGIRISNTYSYKIQLIKAGGLRTMLSKEAKVVY